MSQTGTINHDQSEPNSKLLIYSMICLVIILISSFVAGTMIYNSLATQELNDK